MIFSYAVCSVPVAPLRAEASHRAEMVSQLLFGERVEIMNQTGEWAYVVAEWDQYEGWVCIGQLQLLSVKAYYKPLKALSSSASDGLQTAEGHIVLSPGSSLFGISGRQFFWQHHILTKYKGKRIVLADIVITEELITKTAMLFYGAPYLWGGRNILGIDCSGFSQMVYKMLGIAIPRDAYQQADSGDTIGFLQEAKCGDLAFFDNAEGRITHVGILLNNYTIIHATESSGGVVIDAIDNGGIISRKHKKRTHNLRIVKRYIV